MFRLLRYYSFMSAVALLAVTVILVVLYRQNAMQDLLETAEYQNAALARALSNTLWPRFRGFVTGAQGMDGKALQRRPELREIDSAVRALAAGLPVLKLKIYTLDGLVVFSSEPDQIGGRAENTAFNTVLRRGKPVSDLEFKGRFNALGGVVRERQVVESYLPIKGSDGAIEAVVELYSDVTPFVAMVNRNTAKLVVGLLVVFSAMYAVLLLIVRRADRIITDQHVDLLGSERSTKERNIALEREIGDRRRAEERLRESEARLRDMAESTSDWLWEMDGELRFSYYSDRLQEVTGVDPKDLLGRTREDLGRGDTAPDKWEQHLADLKAQRPFRDFRYKFVAPDGRILHFSVNGKPVFDDDGRFLGYRGTGSDVTAQVEAEERARSAQEHLALAIEGLSDLFVLFDTEDRIVLSNHAWRELNRDIPEWTKPGVRFEDNLRAAVRANLIPDAVGREEDWLQQRMERHRNPGEPFELQRQNGRWIRINEQRLPDGGTVLIIGDITDRKRAEDRLRESERRFRNLVEGSIQGILIHRDRHPLYVNRAWAEMHGYTVDEVLAMDSVAQLITPADRARMAEYRNQRIRGETVPTHYEYEAIRKDGSHIWLENRTTVVTWKDEPAIQSTIVDVSERMRAQERLRQNEALFRAVVDNSPTKIHIKDVEGRYLLVNHVSEELFGVTEADVLGKTSEDIFSEDFAAAARAHDQEVIEGGTVTEREEVWVREDGTRTYLTVKFPIVGPDGTVTAVGAIGTNITERKRTETLNTRLGRIVEHSLNEVYVFDAETLRFVQVNRGARENLGYSMEELTGLTPVDLKPEFTPGTYADLVQPLRDGTQEHITLETVHRRKDGSLYNVDVQLQFMRAETPPVFVAIVQDTTERMQAEEAVRESRRTLQAVIDAVPAMVNAKDDGSRYVFMNRYQADLYGITPDEAVGKTAVELVGKDYGERTRALDQRVFATGRALVNYEEEWGDVYGRQYVLLTNKVPLRDDEDAVVNVVTVALDITQRKQAERERQESERWFRAIVDNSPTAIFLKDTEGHYLLINKTYADWYKVDPVAVRGKTPYDIFTREVADMIVAYDREVLESGQVVEREVETVLKDGTRRTTMVVKFPIAGPDGKPIAVGVIQSDATDRILAEAALRQSEERLRGAVESLQEGFALFDAEDRLVILNDQYRRLNPFAQEALERGLTYEDVLRVNVTRGYIPDAVGREEEFIRERVARHRNPDGAIIRQFADGRWYIIKEARTPEAGIAISIIEITELKRVEEDLRKLSQAVEQSPASVVITTADGNIEYVNPKFVESTGYDEAEVIGQNPRILKSGHMPPEIYRDLWDTIVAGNEWRGELFNKKKNGELFWEFSAISPIKTPDGRVTHFVAVNEDVTLRKEYEERLLRQANFDDLTGLPNRVLALDRLSQALARARRENWGVGLIFVDLDNFKNVNDTLGHAAGDELLVEAARRLTGSVRKSDTVSRLGESDGRAADHEKKDTVARIGGDEFLIILPDLDAPVHAEVVARKILDACSKPFTLNGHDVFVTASIGLTVYPLDGDDPQSLMRNADAAMYRAKEIGRNTYRFFTRQMNEQAAERLKIESHLRYALERGELYLAYQPIVEVATGDLVGAEALLRWRNPDLGLVMPDRFIPVAEGTGLIIPMGEWVLYTVCREAARWQKQHGRPLRVAVNASSRQFRGSDLVTTVTGALEESGLPAPCLEMEITESLLVDDESEATIILQQLSEMGVRLSIDDFGTGYSSLSYLKRFPVDSLKIDRAFVRDVTTDPEDAALAKAIIAMGRSLGLKVIGEGVETEEQLEFLRAENCDLAQGFYFASPLSAEEFAELLERVLDERARPA